MNRTLNNRLLLFGLFAFLLCSCGTLSYNKNKYVDDFGQFMKTVEKEYPTYSEKDWKKADKKYNKYTKDYYNKYGEELSVEEKSRINKYKISYNALKLKYRAGDIYQQTKGAVEGVIESIGK